MKLEATETTMPSAGMLSNLTANCWLIGEVNGHDYGLSGTLTIDLLVNGSPTGVSCTLAAVDNEPGAYNQLDCADHTNEFVYAKDDTIAAILTFGDDTVVPDGFCELAAAVRDPSGTGEHDSIIRIGEANLNTGRAKFSPTDLNSVSYCGPQMTDQSDNLTRICDVLDPEFAAITIPKDCVATGFAVHFKWAYSGAFGPGPTPTPGGGGTETFTWHNLTTGNDLGLTVSLDTHAGPGYSASTEHCTENCTIQAGDQIVLRRDHSNGTAQDVMWREFVGFEEKLESASADF